MPSDDTKYQDTGADSDPTLPEPRDQRPPTAEPAEDGPEDAAAYDDLEADDGYAEELDEANEARGARQRRVVQMPRGLFITAATVAALLVLGLGAATTYLLIDRRGGDDPVVATVNGDRIRRSEYDRAIAADNGSQVLDRLVLERLVEAEAKKRGIAVDDQQTARLIEDQKKGFDSEEQFQSALDQNGLNEQQLGKALRLNELLRQLVGEKANVTDQEITQAYEAGKDQYAGKSLDQAREEIKSSLERQKTSQAVPELLQRLKAGAKIETHVPGKTS